MTEQESASGMLTEPAFIEALNEAAANSNKTPEDALSYARKCLREIEATPRESWLRPVAKLARFIYTRSYEKQLDINLEKIEELRALSKDHLILFLWSHKSHMDSFVFLLSLYDHNFRPVPLTFAGINMNFLGFGAMARRVGAIFLRRSFAEDPIYKLVFRRYIDFLIRNKVPLSWSIEGTRSRTGKLSPPKLGVLNWVVEACEREQMKDVLLVPVSIAFDRIAEIDDYVGMQKGLPKRKESLRWFIDYIFGRRAPHGKVYVRYAEPVKLSPPRNIASDSDDNLADRQRLEITRTAFEVCRRIEQITPIKSADVLTMVLLGANRRALTLAEIADQSSAIIELIEARALPAASGLSLHDKTQVSAAVLAMQKTGLVRAFTKSQTPVYYIPRSQQLAAAYYRNTVTHYFLPAALAEIGLAMCALDIDLPSESTLRTHVKALRNLYKFEFFFTSSGTFWQEVLGEAHERYPGWDDGEHSLQKRLLSQPPRFGHAILRSFTEAYLILAVGLMELGSDPVRDEKKFTRQLLAEGQQMLLRRSISCESSISQDLFVNGLRMAAHRGLLDGPGDELEQARKAFAQHVFEALCAINSLQQAYDTAWFPPLPQLASSTDKLDD